MVEEERAGWRMVGCDIRVRQEVDCDRNELAAWSTCCQEMESLDGATASLTHSANS